MWKDDKNIYMFGEETSVPPRKFKKNDQIIEVETIRDLSKIISVSKNKMWENSDSSWVANKGKKIHEILLISTLGKILIRQLKKHYIMVLFPIMK